MGRKVQVSLRVPEGLHRAAKVYAEEIGSSLNVWINMAIAARIKNWKSPITGKKTVIEESRSRDFLGWFCEHGSHGGTRGPAGECKHRGSTNHRKSWVHDETGRTDYDEWLKEQGEG